MSANDEIFCSFMQDIPIHYTVVFQEPPYHPLKALQCVITDARRRSDMKGPTTIQKNIIATPQ